MVFPSNTRCHDAQHTGMPSTGARDDGCVTRRIELFFDRNNSCRQNFLFNVLACAVLLVQFHRQ
jgi:hypothetical protein